MFKLIVGIVIGFLIYEYNMIDKASKIANDAGVKEAIIEKLQEKVDIDKINNGEVNE